jgi:ABC-type glycerol-3-phosphate transport system substrate-binding protein
MANYLKVKEYLLVALIIFSVTSFLVSFDANDANAVIELNTTIQVGGAGPPAKLMFDMFNKKYEGQIQINTVSVPWVLQFEKTIAEFIAKSTTYDLIPIHPNWLGATTQYMEDLFPYVKKSGFDLEVFPKGLLNLWVREGGKLIGLPFRAGILSLFYYRKDLFEKYNLKVPETMEQLYDNAKVITQKEKGVYGAVLMSGAEADIYEDFTVWFFPQGGRLLNSEQNGVVPFEGKNKKLAIDILTMWKKLHDEELISPAHTAWGFNEVLRAMQQGVIAQASQFSPRVMAVEDPKVSKTVGKWGYSIIFPGSAGKIGPRLDVGGGWVYGINPLISEERKQAAFKVIQFLVSEEAQKKAALEAANGPVLRSLYKDPDYLKIDPSASEVVKGLETFYLITCPQNSQIVSIIGQEGGNAMLGKKAPEAAAKAIWERTQSLFKK